VIDTPETAAPKMPKIYIDADACPVKDEAEKVATRHKIQCLFVCNGGLRPSPNPYVDMIFVPDGPDVADMWIADRAGIGDVVVTGDIPLAAKVVDSGARVIKHNGEPLTTANIGNVLATRDLMTDLRAADPFRQGGGKPFSKADRSRFLDALERAVQAAKRDIA
jgi:uncharacterized protein YaiI (UPF0178 family)